MIYNPTVPKGQHTFVAILTDSNFQRAIVFCNDYYLTLYIKRPRKLFGWVIGFTYEEFDQFIYRPKIKPEFQVIQGSWKYLDEFVKSLGISKGDRPAGYGFIPSDHC